MSNFEIKRGDFFWVKLPSNEGFEIKKVRPCLVISNNQQNKFSQLITVLPLTSKVDDIYPFQVENVLLDKKGIILVDQIRTVDRINFGSKIGGSDNKLMINVEKALHITLALKN